MKIVRRFLEALSLLKTPDAADGSAVAMTDTEQTITGEKSYADGLKVGQDTAEEPKSLIRKADMDNALDTIPKERVDEITLTVEMLAAKQVTLSGTIAAGDTLVKMTTRGSVTMLSGIYFDVAGNILSWAAYPITEALLLPSEIVSIRYIGR